MKAKYTITESELLYKFAYTDDHDYDDSDDYIAHESESYDTDPDYFSIALAR